MQTKEFYLKANHLSINLDSVRVNKINRIYLLLTSLNTKSCNKSKCYQRWSQKIALLNQKFSKMMLLLKFQVSQLSDKLRLKQTLNLNSKCLSVHSNHSCIQLRLNRSYKFQIPKSQNFRLESQKQKKKHQQLTTLIKLS